ncbi:MULTISPECIES: arginine-ornithine antiporter [unclassified Pseudomonas]|uniref:arginine-ornithine antiporter n=1 Tax=unclassified Pseudomonas TaxID=196821 RepID=UPI000871521D|nr:MULTISPECIES: arginine-ornithine antiporter [unclassified Pseudomonas]SCW36349.1 arginine:ornithine antiporter / lysine permease [Pseudomonas sp. NFACC05-1]SCZ19148.1 arginine:ornithine antiporter / lysine permease [Pseudomonas sp. NFACC44-2]SDA46825.1 arginine:ornithine antiporter / lysine permease [Pseudomonas sp. NFACC51]SEI42654.1 arginine:ornithine antiporter / lysine permease [Pseudomonas sp. NFACC07-1]SFH02032.1 arginine:ornithine antiporter / lysine permease [Pseudomonas sp. NFACC54
MATHLQGTEPVIPTVTPHPLAGSLRKVEPRRLSLSLLIALVVGSMIGSGIFSLPQNMAASAGAGAILIGWLITGVGMLSLALVYQTLSNRQPELDNGVFAYARALGGEFLGFNSAWGYWISAWIGNVSYLVILFAALSYFFPVFGEGNNKAAIVGASVVLWALHWMILRGMRTAAKANALTTIAKVVPLLLFIGLVIAAFSKDTFMVDFWGTPALGSTLDQVKSTMLVTVWVFIGIEGANVFSARAAERADVGRATVIGFILTLMLLIAVSLLSLGILRQPELAALKNPSMAGVLEAVAGPWGAVLISIGLIVSVGGALLAWTLLAAESVFTPAKEKVMPRLLATENQHGAPANALWITNGCIQLFLLLTLYSSASYLALISLATSMILLPYLFSGLYALKMTWQGQTYAGHRGLQLRDMAIAVVATGYCVWLLYAAGPRYMLLSALLYAPGSLIYLSAQRARTGQALTGFGWGLLLVIWAAAIFAGWMLWSGQLSL